MSQLRALSGSVKTPRVKSPSPSSLHKHLLDHLIPEKSRNPTPMLGPRSSIIVRIKPQVLPPERPVLVLRRRERQIDHLPDDTHAQGPADDGPDLLGAAHAAVAAVRDDEGGLALPLVEEVVDGVLELGRDAPVALGREEDEGIVRGDLPRPHAGVLVLVVFGRCDAVWDAGFVEDGEVVIFEVDQVDVGSLV